MTCSTGEACVGPNQSRNQPAATSRGVLPAWPVTGDDSFALDSLLASAGRFITLFHDETRAGPPGRRLWHVRREIEMTGTYRHTADELAFGARSPGATAPGASGAGTGRAWGSATGAR